jgi:hypothetical protein
VGLRHSVLARIESGKLTEEMELSSVLDSLEKVELTMEIEEFGIEPTVPIKSVRDLLWLLKAIDIQRAREAKGSLSLRGYFCWRRGIVSCRSLSLDY